MPITQASWLTNLTEADLTVQLSQNLTNMQNTIRDNNQNIDDMIGDYITSVKNDLSAINDKIVALQGNNVNSLIGNTSDGYGTTSSGTVMGKLNYLIYLLAPTPATFNYGSAGTFNNITIPTGVKFISVTACGGSGGGGVGGSYLANNLNSLLYSATYGKSLTNNITAVLANINSGGRRFNMTAPAWSNGYSGEGCTAIAYNLYKSTVTMQIARNVSTPSGEAGTTATVISQSKNVATSEVITVVVGAGGGNTAAGGASTVTTSNGTITASGGAAGTKGSNTPTYSNWVNFYSGTTNIRISGATNSYSSVSVNESFANASTVITVTGAVSKTATANSLGRVGGASGAGASTYLIRNGSNITISNGCQYGNRQYALGAAGSTGSAGYVRVSW